jgi:hypothetical protein
MPIASTSPNSDRLLKLNPNAFRTAQVPIRETGTAQHRDDRGAPALEEDQDDQDDEPDRLEKRLDDVAKDSRTKIVVS